MPAVCRRLTPAIALWGLELSLEVGHLASHPASRYRLGNLLQVRVSFGKRFGFGAVTGRPWWWGWWSEWDVFPDWLMLLHLLESPCQLAGLPNSEADLVEQPGSPRHDTN